MSASIKRALTVSTVICDMLDAQERVTFKEIGTAAIEKLLGADAPEQKQNRMWEFVADVMDVLAECGDVIEVERNTYEWPVLVRLARIQVEQGDGSADQPESPNAIGDPTDHAGAAVPGPMGEG